MKQKTIIACYIVTHLPSGKFYVGSTKDAIRRQQDHKARLKRGIHYNSDFQACYNDTPTFESFFWKFFIFDELLDARQCEQKLLDENVGNPLLLNHTSSVRSPISGLMNEEIRARATAGSRTAVQSEEYRAKQSITMRKVWAVGDRRERRMGGGNPFAKPVWVDGIMYAAVNDAKRALGIDEKTIRNRARSVDPRWSNYSFTNPCTERV